MGKSTRLRVVYLMLVFWLLALVSRAYYLQLVEGGKLALRGIENSTREVALPAARGRIYDAGGRPLARNRRGYSLWYIPQLDKKEPEWLAPLRQALSLGEKKDELYSTAYEFLEFVAASQPLNAEQLAMVGRWQDHHAQLWLDEVSLREYPLGRIFSHVVGYVGFPTEERLKKASQTDKPIVAGERVGQDGIEWEFDRVLRGTPGKRVFEVNVAGEIVGLISEESPVAGSDIYLTIDASMQSAARQFLSESLALARYEYPESVMVAPPAGALVALDPSNGDVKAIVSYPDYDPNWFLEENRYRELTNTLTSSQAPLLNRAISATFPPASTFKVATCVAGFHLGEIDLEKRFYCRGYEVVAGQEFNCFVRSGHGSLDFEEVMAHSCDTYFYVLGRAMGGARFAPVLRSIGFAQKTGIDLPGELAGVIPGPKWKEDVLREKWFPGDDANMSIGQGYVEVTALQMAQLYGAVMNDGAAYQPEIVSTIEGVSEYVKERERKIAYRLPITRDQLEEIRRGLEGVVEYGTARSLGSSEVAFFGKTGTAESAVTPNNPSGKNHTWFVGTSTDPKTPLIVAVVLERSGGYGGELAAPAAKKLIRYYQKVHAGGRS